MRNGVTGATLGLATHAARKKGGARVIVTVGAVYHDFGSKEGKVNMFGRSTAIKNSLVCVVILLFLVSSVASLGATGAQERAQKKVVRLGGFAPVGGDYPEYGAQVKNGIELAVKIANEKGGIDIAGELYTIDLYLADTESKVEVALTELERLITVVGIDAAVGFLHSHVFLKVMDRFEDYGIPVVDSNAASTEIFGTIGKRKMKYVFQSWTTIADFVAGLAGATNHYYKPEKIALLHPNIESGRNDQYWTKRWYSENAPGVEIVYAELYPHGQTDFSAEIAKIRSSGADAIEGAWEGASAISWLTQWYDSKIGIPFSDQGGSLLVEEVVEQHKEKLEGLLLQNTWWPGPHSEISEDRISRYKQEYGVDLPMYAVGAHDAAEIMIQAIDAADSLDPDKIVESLENNTFVGVWGTYKFVNPEHRVPRSTVIIQMQDGKKVPVWPLELAEKLPGSYKGFSAQ